MTSQKLRNLNRYSIGDRVLVMIMLLICFLTLYPVWYTIVLSFNDSTDFISRWYEGWYLLVATQIFITKL